MNNDFQNFQEEEINIREELQKYLKYWPWFLVSIFFALLFSFLYLKLSNPVFRSSATIIIKDEDTKSPGSGMSSFADLGVLDGLQTSSIENEIGLLKSKRMMAKTISSLDLNISYYSSSFLFKKEIYNKVPFHVNILHLDHAKLDRAKVNGLNSFVVIWNNDKITLQNEVEDEQYHSEFGSSLDLGYADIVIRKNENFISTTSDDKSDYGFTIQSIESVVSSYNKRLNVALIDDNSTLIELSLDDQVPGKSRDILDQLIVEYNKEAIIDKNMVATNTAEFIDERLKIINYELDSVEIDKEVFKEQRDLTDIKFESEIFLENASDYKKKRQEIATQKQLASEMLSYLRNADNSEILPVNLGFEAEGLNMQVSTYNKLVIERNRILEASYLKNPTVKKLDQQIEQLKSGLLKSLQRLESNLNISIDELENEGNNIKSRISEVPAMERQYRGIDRQQQIKESLYLYLLQKREENSLSLAVTAPKAKIVDKAFTSGTIAPNSKVIILGGFFIGFFLPLLIIYGKNILNNKIKNRGDLERRSKDISIIGEIPTIDKKQSDLITDSDRSVLAESFRIAITNMQYLLVNKGDKQKGIKLLVTSTVKGEGKTFTSMNLALTLANMGKRVIVVGADLRNPQLQRYVGSRKQLGVSDYLVNGDVNLGSLIEQSELNKNLDFLTSGSIPPNPSELLRHIRFSEMLNNLEINYDYIILDTAPCMLVADTFLISQYADLTLYVVRASYTEKALLQFPIDSKKAGKLHDVSFILNDVDLANFGYGNKYGYSYGADEKSFWQKIKWRF
ncbi:polysaccharide biosynthesis tyrosine autokinase [Zunongwangia sp. SCSIO 43204]|uniref:GumC family protein n=1 Tax=Zunongwangia sp. SCSIO 43204 TaxID=2779359 RepID=UPI001CA98FB9|nr:tyrosine-protein kinase family protein [Zunongwangia sp. SCSIO 43204]UAB84817.1 polysaccharide biosynthesis tyrosine autokinase [Zunongwangia sp. SCSIO 43204]